LLEEPFGGCWELNMEMSILQGFWHKNHIVDVDAVLNQ